jgi:hypothetical protein
MASHDPIKIAQTMSAEIKMVSLQVRNIWTRTLEVLKFIPKQIREYQ